jgi:peptide/nickel transport system substrate-binding protein
MHRCLSNGTTGHNEQRPHAARRCSAGGQWEEQMGLRLLAITTTILTSTVLAVQPTLAQKHGGTLKYYHRDNPPTTSIHEEATISTVNPFMAVFNNLVLFDQSKPREGLDTIVPDLAESWNWSEDGKRITFKLRQGVKWHQQFAARRK